MTVEMTIFLSDSVRVSNWRQPYSAGGTSYLMRTVSR
jgi:hypothetical protein